LVETFHTSQTHENANGKILTAHTRQLEDTIWTTSYYLDDGSSRWPQTPQAHTDSSSQYGSEPTILDATAVEWRYTLLQSCQKWCHISLSTTLYLTVC